MTTVLLQRGLRTLMRAWCVTLQVLCLLYALFSNIFYVSSISSYSECIYIYSSISYHLFIHICFICVQMFTSSSKSELNQNQKSRSKSWSRIIAFGHSILTIHSWHCSIYSSFYVQYARTKYKMVCSNKDWHRCYMTKKCTHRQDHYDFF